MKVSVVIPVYNVMPYLERCVMSVLNQTYKDLEIILVDDGSKDDSGKLCDELATRDERIRVIHQENQGLSAARNTGIRYAIGEYIIFLDSDDEWLLTDGLEQIVKVADGDVDLITFKPVHIYEKNCENSPDYNIAYIEKLPTAGDVFGYLVQSGQFSMSACFVMVRRKLLTDNDIYFPIGLISEDVYWSMQLWQFVEQVKFLNINFYAYNHHNGGLSTLRNLRVFESYDKIFSYWRIQCENGCKNATVIRWYMANMWVNRAYAYTKISDSEKAAAYAVLKRNVDYLNYGKAVKTKLALRLSQLFGIKTAVYVLGMYWKVIIRR